MPLEGSTATGMIQVILPLMQQQDWKTAKIRGEGLWFQSI